jgi:hypothetical protein
VPTPRKTLTAFSIVLTAAPLAAQERWDHKFSFTLGGGVAVPGQDLRGSFTNTGLVRLGFGYRFWRYLQADAGLDAVIHAAGVDFSRSSIIGNLRVRDNEYLVPLGGRAILPIGRVELFAGGGAAYLHYAEEVEVPGGGSDSSFNCTICTSRGGWGYYAVAGVTAAVDRRKRFWVGVETRAFRGRTSGDPLGSVPSVETRDQWVDTAAVFTVRFP